MKILAPWKALAILSLILLVLYFVIHTSFQAIEKNFQIWNVVVIKGWWGEETGEIDAIFGILSSVLQYAMDVFCINR